jgi:hypothetical protein
MFMPQFLTVTLAVLFCVIVLVGCVAAAVSAVLLVQVFGFLVKLADAINDLRAAIKAGLEAQAEGQRAVAEANRDISNKNAQTLMDTLVTLAQMLEIVLKGLGYTPRLDNVDSGLKDIEAAPGSDYSRPPAPRQEEGLKITGRPDKV